MAQWRFFAKKILLGEKKTSSQIKSQVTKHKPLQNLIVLICTCWKKALLMEVPFYACTDLLLFL